MIDITVRKIKDGYRAIVTVNGEFYASADGPTRSRVEQEAQHYASQIEFDEFGNW